MIIKQLILRNYKRLMLSNINCLKLDLTSAIQIILGTNGSGKSSVLAECTPYPGHHKHFAVGGEKFIHLEANGMTYKLRNFFDRGTGTHSFIRDGVELNEGYTYAVQKELVLREFNLDKNVVDLITDVTTFTSMSTEKRREWLSRMAPFNLSYVFKVLANAKEKHRDQVAIIRHATKRMALEHSDSLDDTTIYGYRQQIKDITATLDTLFQWRSNNTGPKLNPEDLRSRLNRLVTQLKRAITTLPSLPLDCTATSQYELVALAARDSESYEREKGILEHLQAEAHRIRTDHTQTEVFISKEDAEKLQVQRNHLTTEIAALEAQELIPFFPVCRQTVDGNSLTQLQSLGEMVVNLFTEIPDNADGHYSREKGNAAKQLAIELGRGRQIWSDQFQSTSTRLAQLKGCEQVVCPNCSHTFIPGVNPSEILGLQEQKLALEAKLDKVEAELRKNNDYLQAFEEYYGYVRKFRFITEQFPTYRQLWDHMLEHKVVYTSPRAYLAQFSNWVDAQRLDIAITGKLHERTVIDRKLAESEVIADGQLSEKDRRLQKLEEDIEAAVQRATEARVRQAQSSARADTFEMMTSGAYDVLERAEALLNDFKDWTESAFQDAVYEETQNNHQRLGTIQGIVTRNDQQAAILDDLKDQHETAKQEHADYGLLVKVLSPTGGLIGQYLMGFMQGLVKLLNAIVGKVWTYPLEVLPSCVEKDELNYYFPLDVQNQSIVTNDIAEGSSAQKDMINFAFKLVAMKFLGIKDFPLLLDELGHTFDETHRINVVNLIENMLELNQVRQVFFISHYASQHGAFTGAEVCVLDDRNISVPGIYNRHVTME